MNERDLEVIKKLSEKAQYVATTLLPPETVFQPGGLPTYVVASQFVCSVLLVLLEENGCTVGDLAEKLNEYKVFSETLK